MPNRVAGIIADVEHESIATLRHPFIVRYTLGEGDDGHDVERVVWLDTVDIFDMSLWDHKDVSWRFGVDVTKGQRSIRLRDALGGYLTLNDATKQTVAHGRNATASEVTSRAPDAGSCLDSELS